MVGRGPVLTARHPSCDHPGCVRGWVGLSASRTATEVEYDLRGRTTELECPTCRRLSVPDEVRVRGWSHPAWEDLKSEVGTFKRVPIDKVGVIVRSLFRNGAKRVVVEDEESWVENDLEVEDGVVA